MTCPKCGSENVEVKLYKEKSGSTTVTTTHSKYNEKGHGFLWWVTIGWWWWIVDLCIWIFAFIPRLAIQLSKKKKYVGSSASTSRTVNDTVYRSVCVCKDCAYNWVALSTSGEDVTRTEPSEPFYKTMWFLVVCGLFLPPVGIALVWLAHKEWDVKKKGIVSGVMAVWFIIVLCSNNGEAADTVSGSDVPAISESSSDTTETKLSFTINGGEPGQYGEWITLGEGTETPDTFIAYKIPYGDYKATNLDPDYPLFIYVYSEATEVVDGVEYQAECLQTVSIQPGESGVFTVPDGYYIQLVGSDSGTSAAIESL